MLILTNCNFFPRNIFLKYNSIQFKIIIIIKNVIFDKKFIGT